MILHLFFLLALVLNPWGVDLESELQDLVQRLKKGSEITTADRVLIVPVWQRYQKKLQLSILEQNLVYYYVQNVNQKALKYSSPVNPFWKIYRRFDQSGYKFAVENNQSGQEIVHELKSLRDVEPLPYFTWSASDLQVFFEVSGDGFLRIDSYRVDSVELKTEVYSGSRDFSPFLSPDGLTLGYLSDRDRTNRQDERTAIYLKDLQSGTERKLTTLERFLPNSLQTQNNLEFKNKETLLARTDKGVQELSIVKLLKERDAERKNLVPVPVGLASSLTQTAAFTFKLMANYSLEEGSVKVLRIRDEILIEFTPKKGEKRLLSRLSFLKMESIPGPVYALGRRFFLFLKEADQRFEIWGLDLITGKERLLSKRLENCCAMELNEKSNILAYLLLRAGLQPFLVIQDLRTNEPFKTLEINGIKLQSGEPLLRIDDDAKVFFKNHLNDWQMISEPAVKKKSSLAELAKPVAEKKTEVTSAPVELTPPQILSKAQDLADRIKKIQSAMDLYYLKLEFNFLHTQVKMHTGSRDPKTFDLVLSRCVRDLNGIRELLDNATILFEVE